jgi:Zn-dependent peptidase ImmA (M78 family)
MRLSNDTYEMIKKRVVDFLEDYGVNRYPLDLPELVRRMGIRLIAYSELSEERRRVALEYSEDAIRIVCTDYSEAIILYNDAMPHERVCYSIAHEVAHIILEHGDQEDEVNESEAEFFAAYLLMPVPLVCELCSPDPYEISEFFGTSISAATYAMKRTLSRLQSNVPVQEYESRLIDNILAAMRGGDEMGG